MWIFLKRSCITQFKLVYKSSSFKKIYPVIEYDPDYLSNLFIDVSTTHTLTYMLVPACRVETCLCRVRFSSERIQSWQVKFWPLSSMKRSSIFHSWPVIVLGFPTLGPSCGRLQSSVITSVGLSWLRLSTVSFQVCKSQEFPPIHAWMTLSVICFWPEIFLGTYSWWNID